MRKLLLRNIIIQTFLSKATCYKLQNTVSHPSRCISECIFGFKPTSCSPWFYFIEIISCCSQLTSESIIISTRLEISHCSLFTAEKLIEVLKCHVFYAIFKNVHNQMHTAYRTYQWQSILHSTIDSLSWVRETQKKI